VCPIRGGTDHSINGNPVVRREALEILKFKGLSERAACRIAGVSRRIASYDLRQPAKDKELGAQLMEASGCYPRFGYRRIASMTAQSMGGGWRLWSCLGLTLPKRRPRKRRCGNDIRIPGATQPNSVWSYDFVHDRLANGSMLKLLCVLNEHWFVSMRHARQVIEEWRQEYNDQRPHSSPGYLVSAEFVAQHQFAATDSTALCC
jgi:transposase InsO family protein